MVKYIPKKFILYVHNDKQAMFSVIFQYLLHPLTRK